MIVKNQAGQRLYRLLASALMLGGLLCAMPALSGPIGTPVLGGQLLVASTGHVHAGFLGTDAYYYNTLYLDSPGNLADVELFNKHTPINTPLVDLGLFEVGTELVFRLDVRNTRFSYYSGDASRNPDGLPHVLATTEIYNGVAVTEVGFEDLFGGGDLDYNDFMFVLTNVIDPPAPIAVPTSNSQSLVFIGLAGLLLTVFLYRTRQPA